MSLIVRQLKSLAAKLAGLDCLRWLLIAEFVSLFISTSLTSVLEIILFATVLFCLGKLRERILPALQQPVVTMTLALIVVLCLGMFYGPVPFQEKIRILMGWRKLLLLLLAILVFDEPFWKQRLTCILVGTAVIGALFSWFGLLGYTPTIVVHNHATQGMFFAVGAFAAMVLILYPPRPARITPGVRWGLGTSAALLVMNIVFVTPGRSGYLALLVLAGVACLGLFRGWLRVGLLVAVPLALVLLFSLSPVAKERLTRGVNEMRGYEQAQDYSSMGIRMVMWNNTVQLIRERPFFGYGLGGLKEAYREKVRGMSGWEGIVIDDPHNQYLKVTAELGLVGLLVFLGFIGSFFWQGVSGADRLLGLGVLLAWCATSLFNGHFSTAGEGRFLMLWCGVQFALPRSAKPDSQA
ncbi:MAG: hypothetical protein A2505_06580 [Deltaproteobacteria bacterium RIFOXYD12_FULL_55_16]|nr:MAG: hypothetical protein A2505_06580 [Deltaproteobacteria bacterium RIFOXYD12_FULL_55_16]